MLNELFVLDDQEQNEATINEYAELAEYDLPVLEPAIAYLLSIVNFGQVKQYDKTKK